MPPPPPSPDAATTSASLQAGQQLDPAVVNLEDLPSPPLEFAARSAKLAALHARIALPKQLPVETLARALVHPTADPNPAYNNESLAMLGADFLGYYMAEHLLAHYPRLPLQVLYAAQRAFVGPNSLLSVANMWGVEAAAEPGGEVDPGLLQFKRVAPGAGEEVIIDSTRPQDRNRRGDVVEWRRGYSSRLVYDDMFGDRQRDPKAAAPTATTLDRASMSFVCALFGGLYLHAGAASTMAFFRGHVLSRSLDVSKLFTFSNPLRDLSLLCAREGFTPPVARLDSESGRASSSPVFVVGVYSGADRLGSGAGSNIYEARYKAAIAALKGWYLYSPAPAQNGRIVLPSELEGPAGQARAADWRPIHVDLGEIVN